MALILELALCIMMFFLDLGDTDESNGHNSVGQSHRKIDLDKEHKGRPQKCSPSMKRGSIPSQ